MLPESAKELLEAGLATWRRTGAPEHAAQFESHAREALADWVPPVGSSDREFHRAWLRAVRDPIGRGWALESLLERLPGDDPIQRAGALAKRIEALVPHGPDPRFGQAIAKINCVQDARAFARLSLSLQRLEDAAEWCTTTNLASVRKFPPASPEIAGLWREVQAAPDDDATVAVLADALQLAGDPRGELLALELLGDDDPARIARRQALIASCGAAWLGPLTRVTGAASFERGVLRRLELRSDVPAHDAGWNALIADPALSTVTELLPGGADYGVYERFVTSPAMHSLARIEAFGLADQLGDMAPVPPSIAHLACPNVPIEEVARMLSFPCNLRSVAIEDSQFEELAAAPWLLQLTAVTLGVGDCPRRGLARWADLPPSMTLTVVSSAHLPPCTSAPPWDFAITLRRGGKGTLARISGAWLRMPIDVLSELPRDTVRVVVDHPGTALFERIRSAIGWRRLEIVHQPASRVATVFTPTLSDIRWVS